MNDNQNVNLEKHVSEQLEQNASEHVSEELEKTVSEPVEQNASDILQFEKLFNNEFISTLKNFVNELDIAFDNIDKTTISKLRKYIKNVEKDDNLLIEEMKQYKSVLSLYAENLQSISFSDKKIKSEKLKFLEELVLFDKSLNFKVFANENKNTKISIIKYLNTMYMSCGILILDENKELSSDELFEKLNDFVKNISLRENTKNDKSEKKLKNKTRGNLPELNGINDLMGSLIGNKEIVDLALDLSKDIQSQNINPLNLMSSLLSGKKDGKINNLIDNVTKKLEKKIESGEIDTKKIEEQASSIMTNLNTSDLNPTDLLNKLMSSQGKTHGKKMYKK